VWFIFSRGWAHAVQGLEVSERTKKRQVRGFFVVLALLYIVMVTATLYLRFHCAVVRVRMPIPKEAERTSTVPPREGRAQLHLFLR